MASGAALWAYIQSQMNQAGEIPELEDLIPLDFYPPEVAQLEDEGAPVYGPEFQLPDFLSQTQGGPSPQGGFPIPPGILPASPSGEAIGLLERPGRALSELLTGGDPARALLEGRASKPSLGYQLFKEGQRPGFQAEDIPAFAVDVLTDPLNLILPPLISKAWKWAKIGTGMAKKTPFFGKLLDDVTSIADPSKRRNALYKMFSDQGVKGEVASNVVRDFYEEAGRKIPSSAIIGRDRIRLMELPDEEVDWLLTKLAAWEHKARPAEMGLFGSMQSQLSMKVMPIVSVFRKWGSAWGGRAADGLERIQHTELLNFGRVFKAFDEKLEGMGLDSLSPETDVVRKASMIVAESGGKNASADDMIGVFMDWAGEDAEKYKDILNTAVRDKKAQELGGWLREHMDVYQQKFSFHRDSRGNKWKVLKVGPKGERATIDFDQALVDNYAPHTWDFSELTSEKKMEAAITAFSKKHGIPKPQARIIFQEQMAQSPAKYGNIEIARTFEAGGYELDPVKWFPRYVQKAEHRLAFADEFGQNGEDWDSLMKAIGKNTPLDEPWLNDITRMVMERNPKNYKMADLMKRITGFQVLTKMGLGSTISNASQSINTISRDGLGNFMRGVVGSFSEEGQRVGAIAYHRAIQDMMKELQLGIVPHGAASKYLDWVGFNFIEKWNRTFAANSGVATVKRLATDYARTKNPRLADRLQRYGLTKGDVVRLEKGEGFGRDVLDRVALMSSENTQHATHWQQLPKIWRTPEARMMLQYKNFAYNQTRFIFREIFEPALQFVGSKGKKGDMMPFIRFSPLFVGAGQGVAYLRDTIRRPARGLITGDWKGQEEAFWEADDPVASMARNTLMVGSIGILGDMWTAAERGKLMDWAVGPTISDVGELARRGVGGATRAYQGKDLSKDYHSFRNWMLRRTIPGVAAHVPWDVDLSEALGRLGR